MDARSTNPALAVPGAMDALVALGRSAREAGLSPTLVELVNLRASQLNGCGVCTYAHARDLRQAGEPDERIDTVAGWPDSPFFTDAERAALALTEAVTRLADRSDPVPDAVYDEAARYFDGPRLAALLVSIAAINVWNRLNVATRQVAGATW